MDPDTLWPQAADLLRLAVVAPLSYVALIVILRVSGKRMLSKMNAFDLIVTVALGSTLATVVLSKQVALAEGVLALALLVALQYVVAWSGSRSPRVRRVTESRPTLVLFRGQFLSAALRDENLAEDDVRSALRSEDIATLQEVEAVVLEANGKLSVIHPPAEGGSSTLEGVKVPPGLATESEDGERRE